MVESPIEKYDRHLVETAKWLFRSIEHGNGGSCAFWSPFTGWSRPYPETSGYIIPTLFELSRSGIGEVAERARTHAFGLGEWLREIQRPDGLWQGGLYSPKKPGEPSVFNTAQVLLGMCSLYRETADDVWLEAAVRGAARIASNVRSDGHLKNGDYHEGFSPSYYTRVAWPMLEVATAAGDSKIKDAAGRILTSVLSRRKKNGAFCGWAFAPNQPAFTHTIAYLLRGFLESARLVGDNETYVKPVLQGLEKLRIDSELSRGNLPGAYDSNWRPVRSFKCLTGNSQVAICLLILEESDPDLRLVNAAAKLVDTVCGAQRLSYTISSVRGAVPGSVPLWGQYMRFRYPNWAAKFHCDALLLLTQRLKRELS